MNKRMVLCAAMMLLSGVSCSAYTAGLMGAIERGDTEKVKQMLNKGVNVNFQDSSTRHKTPLTLAAQEGNVEIAKLLLDHGADIDGRQYGNWTALTVAVYFDKPSMVEFLLNHGARVNIVTAENWTALSIARGRSERSRKLSEQVPTIILGTAEKKAEKRAKEIAERKRIAAHWAGMVKLLEDAQKKQAK
jgi:hypothetical protein